MGKPNDFKTNNDFFSNNFNFNNSGIGSKNNIVDRRDDRFNETVKYIQQAVKDINALHLLSYIDAVYIYKLKEVKKVKSINVKTEKKFNNNILNSVYNNYLYYDIKNNNEYENNEYLKHNFKHNSCLLTVIIDTYYNQFNKKKSDGKRMFKNDITYEYLCDLLELEYKDSNIGCTIEESLKFFQKFNLGLKVFDNFCNLIYDYTPSKMNYNIKPSTLYLITINSHVFRLKDDIKSLETLYKKSILQV